jgi:nitrite reductase/ring-hydroxylating ferredoxin subunit
MTNLKDMNMLPENQWVDVCNLDDITPNTGVGALIAGQSVALFRVGHEKRIYALSNKDPFSQANVMCAALLVIYKVSGDCITDLQTTF